MNARLDTAKTSGSDTPLSLERLRELPMREVRRVIDRRCFERSMLKGLGSYAFDLVLYAAFIAGALNFASPWLKLACGLLAGCAVAFMFVWAHDAAHGALFQSRKLAEVLGTLFMLPSMNMYRLWAFGHNRVHHGFTSYSPIDWIWRPWTPEEYAAKPRWRRLLYRMERTPYGCALHYLIHVWWQGMIRFKPEGGAVEQRRVRMNKLLTLGFFFAYSGLAYWLGGGWVAIVAAVIVPFLVFNYFIAFFVFLHHTHPDLPFFAERAKWSQSIAQLFCSTVIRCSPVSEFLIHNILIHAPHHISPGIPFYHLKRAYRDVRRHYGEYIHEYRFRWSHVRHIFKRCKLYDYANHTWLTYRDAAARMHLGATAAA